MKHPGQLLRGEAGWDPAKTDVGHDFLGDLALGQEQRKHLLLPELEEGLGSQLGQRQE
jgi:hypothetical protein